MPANPRVDIDAAVEAAGIMTGVRLADFQAEPAFALVRHMTNVVLVKRLQDDIREDIAQLEKYASKISAEMSDAQNQVYQKILKSISGLTQMFEMTKRLADQQAETAAKQEAIIARYEALLLAQQRQIALIASQSDASKMAQIFALIKKDL